MPEYNISMKNKLTAGYACNLVGLKGVDELCELCHKDGIPKPKSTVYDLFKNNRLEFNLLLYGAAVTKMFEALNNEG